RRLVGDGVQDRRVDGVPQRVREGTADAARAGDGAGGDGARRRGRRDQRRPELAPRPAARDGAERRRHDGEGGGADGGGADLQPGAHLADGRPRRLPHAVPALRGGSGPHRPEARRGGEEGKGGRSGLTRGYAFPMSRVTKVATERTCAICERTLLMGERAIRFSPNGGADYVDVCPLCA